MCVCVCVSVCVCVCVCVCEREEEGYVSFKVVAMETSAKHICR